MTGRWRLVLATAAACLCADTSFGSLYRGWGWLGPTALAVVVVIGASEAIRRSPIPSALGPLIAAVTTLLAISWLDAGSPIPLSVERSRLALLLHQGANVVHKYAAPVPATRGSVLLAVIGIAAVTLVVDLCVLTLERAALAAPPLLAVYVVAALLTHHGVGWWPFVLLAAGFLTLLAAETDETRRRWGRHFRGVEGMHPMRIAAGRRLGVAAVALAAVIPLLLPNLHPALRRSPSGSGGIGPGGSQVVTVNPLVSIANALQRSSNATLLTYRTNSVRPTYLRLTALDQFDGNTFSPSVLHSSTSSPVIEGRPFPPKQAEPTTGVTTTTINVGPLSEHWAPAPFGAEAASISGAWFWDQPTSTLWSSESNIEGLDYTVDSVDTVPSTAQLLGVSFDSVRAAAATGAFSPIDLQVPTAMSPQVTALAVRLKRATPLETAMAIQQHLRSPPFGYDLSVPATDSADALATFLFKTKLGFCQQYAAAMTVLARLDGIPARVAVGFTQGQQTGPHTWTVTGGDAHAWPELWFPGFGWLPFEPTPRSDGQTHTPAYAAIRHHHGGKSNGVPGQPFKKPTGKTNQKSQPSNSRFRHDGSSGAETAAGPAGRISGDIGLGVLAALVLALLLPGLIRLTNRQRHSHPHGDAAAAHAAWDEVKDTALDLGYAWPTGVTPRTAITRLLKTAPELQEATAPLERITVAEQQARYAAAVSVDGRSLRSDVVAVRTVMLARASRGQRLRASLLPRSSIRSAGAAWQRRPGWRRRSQPRSP